MFGMSMTEIVIIAVVALLILGPDELPKAARTVGKTLRDMRKVSDDLRDTFEREVLEEKPVRIRPVAEAVAASAPLEPVAAPPADAPPDPAPAVDSPAPPVPAPALSPEPSPGELPKV